jgi:hypothetical protein
MLTRLRGLLGLRALRVAGPLALSGSTRLVPVFLPVMLRVVAALAMVLLAGGLPSALMTLLPLRLVPRRR